MNSTRQEKQLARLMEIWEDAEISEAEWGKLGRESPGAVRAREYVRSELQKLKPRLSPKNRGEFERYFGEREWDLEELRILTRSVRA